MDLVDVGVLFFALLTVAAGAAVLVCWLSFVVLRFCPGNAAAVSVVTLVRSSGRTGAAVVAAVTVTGSLFMSEVAGFVPCELCWLQRVAAWPLAVLCVVGAVRRDRAVWTYVVPLAAVGAAVSVWHLGVERLPSLVPAGSCGLDASCATRWVWEFGFVSLPLMALVSFAAVSTAVFAARHS